MITSSQKDYILIRQARQHNLKAIDLDIPRNRFVVITGPSGSGKSSLAFDTIYAEGQRRYVESLSTYARQFLDLMEKPDVDTIEGLSPAVAIQQRGPARNPRSTVGTITEIYDHLRLLFARAGTPYCPKCGQPIERHTIEQIVDIVLNLPERQRIQILAPLVRNEKGAHLDVLETLRKQGYVRVRIDGEVQTLDGGITPQKSIPHNIDAVVDRLVVGSNIAGRLADSLETALNLTGGLVTLDVLEQEETTYSTRFACTKGHFELGDLEPRLFSFNSPHGACQNCNGLGTSLEITSETVVPDPSLSIAEGAISPWGIHKGKQITKKLHQLAEHLQFSLSTPFQDLSKSIQTTLLRGSKQKKYPFIGIIPELQKNHREATTEESCPTACGAHPGLRS